MTKTGPQVNEKLDEAMNKYIRQNRRMQNGAISEVDESRKEVLDILSEYAGEDGKISKDKVRKILRKMENIDSGIQDDLMTQVDDTIDKTTDKAIKSTTVALGSLIAAGVISEKVIRKKVRDKMFEANKDGMTVEKRIERMSGGFTDKVRTDIRSGVLSGKSITSINRKLSKTFKDNEWQIRRMIMAEGMHAYRESVGYIAKDLKDEGFIKAVKIIDNRGRHPHHHSHQCYILAEQDMYGWGKGVYRPEDTFIYNPHPQCTAYYEFVLVDDHSKGSGKS